MSYSKAAICNIALGHLGINRLVSDVDADSTAQAQALRTHYDLALDVTTKAHLWPFAQRTATLAAIVGYTASVWAYAYRGPADLLLARALNRTPGDDIGVRYELGGDATGPVIYTNESEAVLDYTASVTAVGLFPADFVEALAYQIAYRVAQPLAADAGLKSAAERGFNLAIGQGMTNASNQGAGQEPEPDAFTAARGLTVED